MDGFGSALRDELMAATRRPPARRRGVVAVGTAVTLAVVLVLVALAATDRGSSPAAADVDVTRRGGQVLVRLLDRRTTAEEIERATGAAGLDVRVRQVAVGPSNVGRFVGVINVGGGPAVQQLDRRGESFMAFSVPDRGTGRLTLDLGRPARRGERYGHASDALAPGEPLACLDLIGRPLSSLGPVVEDRPWRVRVQAPLRQQRFASVDEAVAAGLGGELIGSVSADAPNDLAVAVGALAPPSARADPC